MKLAQAIEIGKSCGLTTLNEIVYNIKLHAIQLFDYDNIDKELQELDEDVYNYMLSVEPHIFE